MCMGYSNNLKDLKKNDENINTLFTGDIAYFDKENFFYITGRIKRIIKMFGIRISLEDVEIFLKNRVKTECKILDDKLYIQYNMKNIELNYIKKFYQKS